MAEHEHIYGMAEDKCKIEVTAKLDVDMLKTRVNALEEGRALKYNAMAFNIPAGTDIGQMTSVMLSVPGYPVNQIIPVAVKQEYTVNGNTVTCVPANVNVIMYTSNRTIKIDIEMIDGTVSKGSFIYATVESVN